MTLALLHINDHCLRLIAENGETCAETGFSFSDDHGLVSGSAAYETAWTNLISPITASGTNSIKGHYQENLNTRDIMLTWHTLSYAVCSQ